MKLFLLSLLFFLCSNCVAYDVVSHYKSLEQEYENAIASGNYKLAIEKSLELNGLDPSDTNVLLYIVFAHIKSKEKIPEWVFRHPWPNVTTQDKINRQIAETLANAL